jgi:hypothetical protein
MKYSLTWFKGGLLTMTFKKVKQIIRITTMADRFITSRQVEEIKGVLIDHW